MDKLKNGFGHRACIQKLKTFLKELRSRITLCYYQMLEMSTASHHLPSQESSYAFPLPPVRDAYRIFFQGGGGNWVHISE